MELDDFRREYLQGGLEREDLVDDPIQQFELWLSQAVAGGITDPTAMVLATVEAGQRPWQRMVLLKDVSREGFVFYTNLESRKARAMAENPQVCLQFPWNILERQVIVGGRVERLSNLEVARYFLSRPRESQLAAWASAQSRPISARAVLEEKFLELKNKFSRGEIPLPSFWGGYRVVPEEVEFWQGGAHRLHDRFLYARQDDLSWSIERLSP
ncbi:MAG: pyridoxamine 5'-phosphate oxidase [Halieaceae bacterium]|jgi:pyridoxamine 5'-phosphate oxidase|nr:pyridoxamine 5'-phosphate oxidase [Halieaceae bacterium]